MDSRRALLLFSALAAAVLARAAEPILPRRPELLSPTPLASAIARPAAPAIATPLPSLAPAPIAESPLPVLRVDVSRVGLNEKSVHAHYSAALRQAAQLVKESQLSFPKEAVEIQVQEDNAGVLAGRRDKLDIKVPYRWVEKMGPRRYTKHPVHSLPVFYHELGHGIFRENAERSDSPFASHFQLMRREADLIEKGFDFLRRIEQAKDEAEMAAVRAEMEPVKAEFYSVQEKTMEPAFRARKNVLDAFNEFFADTTAVLVTRNPRAIVEPYDIASPGNRSSFSLWRMKFHAPRDFSDPRNRLGVAPETREIHDYFAPARYAVYETFLRDSPSFGRNRGEVYNRVYSAVIRASTAVFEVPTASPAEMNRRLIAELAR